MFAVKRIRGGDHHSSLRITAFGAWPAAVKIFAERGQIRIVAAAQLLGMDAGGDEQAIDAEIVRALQIGAHRIPDRQHAVERNGAGE